MESFDDEMKTAVFPRQTTRVLVVEDDANLRALLVERLRHDAFEVLEAVSGDDALCLLSYPFTDHPLDVDLLVLDNRMPGLTGLELARMLRGSGDATPMLLITAFPDQDLRAEAAALDIHMLPKPFQLERFSDAAIQTMLA
ncbi:MAG TPA: response regulator [Kofleriaceae bacterium]|jgi:two-component system response regulator MprA